MRESTGAAQGNAHVDEVDVREAAILDLISKSPFFIAAHSSDTTAVQINGRSN